MVTNCLRNCLFSVVAAVLLASSAFASPAAGVTPQPKPCSDGSCELFSGPDIQLKVSETPAEQRVDIHGVLFPQDADTVSHAIGALITSKPTEVVMSNFGGGTNGPTQTFIAQLKSICAVEHGCKLRTLVPSGFSCASNCITVFMAGVTRQASAHAVFGFHEASNGPNPAPGVCESAYREAGISAPWLTAHAALFSSTKVTRLHPSDLVGSGIVTEVTEAL